ncbi:MAG TPA: sigma-54-dependent Fis family transcriptional regulator [Polyangiaceae bacterium]|jgi:Nif-specific regulatory protein|nr:sigma-54-dependent Fis family transcriptional regulator [Polyangiaceae bacterium]
MGLEAAVPADEGWRLDRERSTAAPVPEQLAALARIGQELTSGPTLPDGFRRAMRLLDERLGATHSALFTTNAGQRSLSVEALYGAAPEDFRVRFGLGVAGRVAEAGRPIVVPAVRQEPMALSELTAVDAWHGEHLSLVSVPILSRGRCVGALSVYFTTDPSIGFATRLNLVQVVAAVIAQGLPNPVASVEEPAAEPNERAVFEYANMIGSSPAMRQVYEEIGQVAPTNATALILGESGTGKELVAQAIHANSQRARRPFVKISAAAFPETLFESELFGYERGAFTGAVGRKKGRLDWAEGGTLFLDEIGDLSLQAQVKLLRVLQFREFERLGGTETLKADVRLIAATNKNMEQATLAGTFREDLYYRLNVFTITVPSLRERRTDVPTLVEYFVEKYSTEHRRKAKRIASSALDILCQYGWPGNVRELENAIERAVVSCEGSVVEERHLPKTLRVSAPVAAERKPSLGEAVEQLERRLIEDALTASKGNLARASRALGTTERILRYKVSKYNLEPLRTRSAP